jgi:sec-independent protein translocase protein TatC
MNNPHRSLEPVPPRDAEGSGEPDTEASDGPGAMPFLEHLEELRRRLWKSSLAIAAGMLGAWLLAPIVLADLIHRTVGSAVVLSPFEAFNERFKLSFILGLGIALPIVSWQAWSFVVPGLLQRERRWVPWLAVASTVLFAAGAAAAYFYVVPLVVQVLAQFLVPGLATQIRLSFLLDFTYNLALACGILMQLPMVTLVLTGVGIVTPAFLLRQWRYALVAIFVLTALITPGDVVSAQFVMGGPMVLLYFVSVGLSFVVARRREERERREGWS